MTALQCSLKSLKQNMTDSLTEWVTRSPIELSWTAKKETRVVSSFMHLVDHSFPFLYGFKLLVTARSQSWNDIQLAPTLWWYFKGKWTLCCRHNHNSESLFWTKCAFPLIMSADWSCYQSPMRSYWAGIKKYHRQGVLADRAAMTADDDRAFLTFSPVLPRLSS